MYSEDAGSTGKPGWTGRKQSEMLKTTNYEDVNWVALSGTIKDTPRYITVAHKQTVRFQLEMNCRRPGFAHSETLLVNVSVYGEPAERGYAFLRAGARIGVFGMVDVREFADAASGKPRKVQEVVAVQLVPSFGADFERGQRQMETLGLGMPPILTHSASTGG
jgi:single-stranded DNA-binding protein